MCEKKAWRDDVPKAPMRPLYVADMGQQDPDRDLVTVAMTLTLNLPPIDALKCLQFSQDAIGDFR